MYTAIDIGSSAIKTIVADYRKDGRLKVVGAIRQSSSGLRKGVVVDASETINALRKVIEDLRSVSRKATQNIYVNVNGDNIKTHSSKGVAAVSRADGEILHDDIERALQASRAIHLPPSHLVLHNITKEFLVDDIGDIADPAGMNGSRLEVNSLVVSAFAPFVNNLIKYLEKSGGSIGGLVFNPIASSRSVLTKKQMDLGAAAIDIGFGTTTLSVYEEGKLIHAACLPIGAGNITNDLAVGLKMPVETAETIKLAYGYALSREISRRDTVKMTEIDQFLTGEVSRRFLSEIIEIRLAEIFELVNNELKLIKRNSQLPAGIVLTGGGAKLAGIAELAKQELKLSAQIGLPHLDLLDTGESNYNEILNEPEFSVAVGLLLAATDQNQKSEKLRQRFSVKKFLVNFLP